VSLNTAESTYKVRMYTFLTPVKGKPLDLRLPTNTVWAFLGKEEVPSSRPPKDFVKIFRAVKILPDDVRAPLKEMCT